PTRRPRARSGPAVRLSRCGRRRARALAGTPRLRLRDQPVRYGPQEPSVEGRRLRHTFQRITAPAERGAPCDRTVRPLLRARVVGVVSTNRDAPGWFAGASRFSHPQRWWSRCSPAPPSRAGGWLRRTEPGACFEPRRWRRTTTGWTTASLS